jgi:hypothetical protein
MAEEDRRRARGPTGKRSLGRSWQGEEGMKTAERVALRMLPTLTMLMRVTQKSCPVDTTKFLYRWAGFSDLCSKQEMEPVDASSIIMDLTEQNIVLESPVVVKCKAIPITGRGGL